MESSPHAGFAVTESLEICYCNPAWDRFALENGGGPGVLTAQVLGNPLLHFVAKDLETYFQELFHKARATGRMQAHDYECSTPEMFRIFRMQLYPLQAGCGFVVINSRRVEHPHTREAHEPDSAIYRDTRGLIHMCANCRRTRQLDTGAWDWVPAYVYSSRLDLSHTVCPFCREYYYGACLPGAARHSANAPSEAER